MTTTELTAWMQHPESLGEKQSSALKEICEVYPYFAITRMLWLKSLQNMQDVRVERETRRTATYCPDRRQLYFLLFPDKKPVQQEPVREQKPLYAFGGDYFTIQSIDVYDHPEDSLKSLAQKLREARQKSKETVTEQNHTSQPSKIQPTKEPETYTEERAIQMIKQKRYEEALKILHVLHLNIPEKSVYFADQIRFLEKIITTIHKS
ncbi:hypothetical protein [Microbacter margulisiae]|uniref:Uncharacterized protein n=1 Tax=Microbacter margulisiae TaxID=1350067 RepID=A0A7W5H270_9PORP|nr:hypothetical protein [Microbacter margulisiae]MBB3188373.1 hypothetical protein [Microbacter margulisiae]